MRVLLLIALAACASSRGPGGPSWPESHARDRDGGESLAPRAAARAIASVIEEDKPADRSAADKSTGADDTAATASTSGDKPAADKPGTPSTEEPPITEEIVIEIESDSP